MSILNTFKLSALLIIMSTSLIVHAAEPNQTIPNNQAQAALEQLMEGNKRYLSGKSTCGWTANPSDEERRMQLANTQAPFAIILGCSDSRVPPEIIFDQRLGSLFVIRVAGNVLDNVVLGSIEYAARFLEKPTPLIFVLGHERCGAVMATINVNETKKGMQNHISSIIEKIMPIVLKTKKVPNHDFATDVITANIQSVVGQLKNSTPLLIEAVNKNELQVVGGYYDLDSGQVTLVE